MLGHGTDSQKKAGINFGTFDEVAQSISPKVIDIKELGSEVNILFTKVSLNVNGQSTDWLLDRKDIRFGSPETSLTINRRTLGKWSCSEERASELDYVISVFAGTGRVIEDYQLIEMDSQKFNVIADAERDAGRLDFFNYGRVISEISGMKLFEEPIQFEGYHFRPYAS